MASPISGLYHKGSAVIDHIPRQFCESHREHTPFLGPHHRTDQLGFSFLYKRPCWTSSAGCPKQGFRMLRELHSNILFMW